MKRIIFTFCVLVIGLNVINAQCPLDRTVSGGGTACIGASFTISLASSQTGVAYQLKRFGNQNVQSPKGGTGGTLTWTVTSDGPYTVVASKSGCTSVTMSTSATVTINPLPTLGNVIGSNLVTCGSSANASIGVNFASQTNVNYQLQRGGANVGAPVTGTGAQMLWTNVSTPGSYTIVATSTAGCTQGMSGAVVVSVITPPTQFTVGGGGTRCSGDPAATITLNGADPSGTVYYYIKRDGQVELPGVPGFGTPITWTKTLAGTYTVEARKDGCPNTQMSSSATVVTYVSPGATLTSSFLVACEGSPQAALIGIVGGSQTDTYYQLRSGATNVGLPVLGNGVTYLWTDINTPGTYSIAATHVNSCPVPVSGSATVIRHPLPTDFSVTVGSSCSQSIGPKTGVITLNGSQSGMEYQLKNPNTNFGVSVSGTGNPITWNNLPPGSYLISATNNSTGCTRVMNSNVAKMIYAYPEVYNVSGGGTLCNGSPGLPVSLSSSTPGVNYQLKINGVNSGSFQSGTGSQLTWPNLTTMGDYSVTATNATSGCSTEQWLSAKINPAPTKFDVTGGPYCEGSIGAISLSDSEPWVSYRLLRDNSEVFCCKTGTGGPIVFQTLYTSGTFTIETTDCAVAMNGNAVVFVNPAPLDFTVDGGGNLCSDATPVITLNSSQSGINYQLKRASVEISTPFSGNGSQLRWTNVDPGTYTVEATNAVTGCKKLMPGNAIVTGDALCSTVNKWAFQYKYDGRRRMTHKKEPGADWAYVVYDNRDRIVMTQDGEQRKVNKWGFIKYDELDRPIITGIYTHGSSIDQVGMSGLISTTNFYEAFNGNAGTDGYTNTVFSSSSFNQAGFETLAVSYYDNYQFRSMLVGTEFNFVANDLTGQAPASDRVVGLATGTKIKVLQPGSSFLWSVHYYDKRYRVIQIISNTTEGSLDRTTNVYDFVKLKETKTSHTLSSHAASTKRTFDYDDGGRPTKIWHATNGGNLVLLSQNEYNELGQIVTKKLYNTDSPSTPDNQRLYKQHQDFRYNIRGWLTRINNSDLTPDLGSNPPDLFGMNLFYNESAPEINNSPAFNGNISAMKWSVNQGLGVNVPVLNTSELKERAYVFSYDPISRLNSALQQTKNSNNQWNPTAGFSESNLSYDFNGNIKSLNRGGESAPIDQLTYTYTGNQLQQVTDASNKNKGFIDGNATTDYTYDANGNMTSDLNKSITSITYNHFNLPTQVTKPNAGSVSYIYDATGRKLSQSLYDAGGVLKKKTIYAGDFFYENDTLKFINHEEGRIVMTGATPEYQYHLKDHLGNVRVTFTSKPEQESVTGTLEPANVSSEYTKFIYYEEAVTAYSEIFDHTNNQSVNKNGYAVRLTGATTNKQYGLAKSLSVMPGDLIKMSVHAKYVQRDGGGNWPASIAGLMGQITDNEAGVVIDGGLAGSIGNAVFPFIGMINKSSETSGPPKAYLNYIVFDRNYMPVDFGYRRVTTFAQEHGSNSAHEYLSKDDLLIRQPGYVYIYLSNENETPVDVFFDDFTVEQIKSPVVQTDDYYPFGLTFSSYQRENSVANLYQYNGKEKQDELNLGWLDYGARMYMPEIGRWQTIDPLAESRYWMNPYNYVQNNPLSRFDPTGMKDDYAMDKKTGDIKLTKKTDDKTDRLLDKENGKVIASKVDKGLLKDGMNIKQNGLETSNVKGGTKLAVKISMYVEEEIQGTVYKNSEGKSYLKVDPYNTAEKYIGKDNGDFYMTTGRSSMIQKDFTSSDGTFSGKAVAAWHTHPGWTGFPQFGTPEASLQDDDGIMANKIHNKLIIPFIIYAKYQMTDSRGRTSNVSVNKFNTGFMGGVTHQLLPQSYGVEPER